jgi:hypothetical protein
MGKKWVVPARTFNSAEGSKACRRRRALGEKVVIEKWDASITAGMEVYVCGTRGTIESPLFEAWLEASSGLGSRNKT